MEEITVPVTFKIGTLTEMGIGALRQGWISAPDPRNPDREFALTCGAGLGNDLMTATVLDSSVGDKENGYLVAETSVQRLAAALFDALGKALDKSLAAHRAAPADTP